MVNADSRSVTSPSRGTISNALRAPDAADEMELAVIQATPAKTGRGGAVLLCLAAVLPLLYLLSTGPVLGLYHRGYLGANSGWYVSTFYVPIEYLCQHHDGFGAAVRIYLTPWLPDTPPGTPTFGVY